MASFPTAVDGIVIRIIVEWIHCVWHRVLRVLCCLLLSGLLSMIQVQATAAMLLERWIDATRLFAFWVKLGDCKFAPLPPSSFLLDAPFFSMDDRDVFVALDDDDAATTTTTPSAASFSSFPTPPTTVSFVVFLLPRDFFDLGMIILVCVR